MQLSATRGDNLTEWYTWLREQLAREHQEEGLIV
jgi:hypothetical protein